MFGNKVIRVAGLMVMLSIAVVACGGATQTPVATEPPSVATEPPSVATEPPTTGGLQIPDVEEGKFNVAMVLIGPHDDGGWSQAHYEGLLYVEENVPNVHTAYIENVPEGADSEQG